MPSVVTGLTVLSDALLTFLCTSSRTSKADWETHKHYCDNVKKNRAPFNQGRVLTDLIDLHIFDFIQGNMDTHL